MYTLLLCFSLLFFFKSINVLKLMWRGLCQEDGFRFWCSFFFFKLWHIASLGNVFSLSRNCYTAFNVLHGWRLDGADIETYWSWWQSAGCPGRSCKGGWSRRENKCLPLRVMPGERRRTQRADWSACSSIDFRMRRSSGPNKASDPDCLASDWFINVKSSLV